MTLTELLRVADESRDDEMKPSQITCNKISRNTITVITILKPRSCGSYARELLLDNEFLVITLCIPHVLLSIGAQHTVTLSSTLCTIIYIQLSSLLIVSRHYLTSYRSKYIILMLPVQNPLLTRLERLGWSEAALLLRDASLEDTYTYIYA